MMKALMNPVAGKAILRTLVSVGKLGAIAAVSLLAQQTFRASGDMVLENAIADFRKVKFMATEEA